LTAGRRCGAFLAGLLATVLLLAGCSTVEPAPPHVRVADLRLLDSTVFEQRFEINLRIGNPNDFALPLDGLTFDLEVNGETFARGFSNQRVTIPRLGEGSVSVAASTTLVELLRQMQLLAGRADMTYRLRGFAYLDSLERRTVPYESEGSFRLLPTMSPGQSI
jgi:LEA14-like dessication related protein